jgi:hypothetical protein
MDLDRWQLERFGMGQSGDQVPQAGMRTGMDVIPWIRLE